MIKRRSSMKFRGVPSPLVLSSPSSGGTQRTSPSASLIREGAGPFFFFKADRQLVQHFGSRSATRPSGAFEILFSD